MAYVPRLKELYKKEVVKKMQEQFGYKNLNQVPEIKKLVVNVGMSKEEVDQKELVSAIEAEIAAITGQKPLLTKSKKSVAGFKIRQGMPLGYKVTLRGHMMYEFIDRLVNVALPRVRDFRGVSEKSFDERGNYSMGLKEQIVFPEINVDKVKKTIGMDITFVTTTDNKEAAKELLRGLGMPFNK